MDHELEELRYAARYPFTKTAKTIITGKEVKIDYEVMERASRRASNGVIYESIPILDTSDKNFLTHELLSYPIAKMIVSLMDRKYLNRYVNAEVKRSVKYMRENEGDEKKISEEFGIKISGPSGNIDVRSYLKYVPKSKEFSISNQSLNDGSVTLDPAGRIAVISEAMKQYVQAGMPIKKGNMPKEIVNDIEEAAGKIQKEAQDAKIAVERIGKITMGGEMAPCMKRLLEQLRNGENVPHIGRWVIAAYLMKRGFGIDEIIALFSNTPNFNEKTTRYQLEFIKKKGYGIPTCMNLDSYGLCIERCGTKSPLQYGTRRSFMSSDDSKGKEKRDTKRFGRK